MWCVPELDDEYDAKMEDVLDLYERPYDANEPVVCLDERPVQLRGDKRERRPARPGKPARCDYEYVRLGTANIFCAVEPLAGKHMAKVTATRSGAEFAKMLMNVATRYPNADTIHLVVDNLNSHTLASLVRHYGERRGRCSGHASRSITRRSTGAGSTKPSWRSASSTASASAAAASAPSTPSTPRSNSGYAASTAKAASSRGASRRTRPAEHLPTILSELNGRRTSTT